MRRDLTILRMGFALAEIIGDPCMVILVSGGNQSTLLSHKLRGCLPPDSGLLILLSDT